MEKIYIKVCKQNLRISRNELVSDTKDMYECEFEFDDEWLNLQKWVVFKKGNEVYKLPIEDNRCVIPFAPLETDGFMQIGVYGIDGDKRYPTIYSTPIVIKIGCIDGIYPPIPTPSEWEIVIAKLQEIEEDIAQIKLQLIDNLQDGEAINSLQQVGASVGSRAYSVSYADASLERIKFDDVVGLEVGMVCSLYYKKSDLSFDYNYMRFGSINEIDGNYVYFDNWPEIESSELVDSYVWIKDHTELGNVIIGDNAIALNQGKAIQSNSFASGNSQALAKYSFASGRDTEANGYGSFSEGRNTKANGMYSHAKGYQTEANGISSSASGNYTKANHDYSSANGIGTKTSKNNQFVVGRYNQDNPNAIFVVGKGTNDSSRANAFEVTNDGIKIGNYVMNEANITGKQLSQENYTTQEKNKLATLENYDDTQIQMDLQSLSNRTDLVEFDVSEIQSVIPSQTSSTNQLADKQFVNSSIATNTANFRGTFTSISDFPTTGNTPNDYAFLKVIDSTTQLVKQYDRYKWNNSWQYEYTLNNSSFTANQWNTINSGLTSADKTKLDGINQATQNTIGLVRPSSDYGVSINSLGKLYSDVLNVTQYNSKDTHTFVSKGTLENRLTSKQDSINFQNPLSPEVIESTYTSDYETLSDQVDAIEASMESKGNKPSLYGGLLSSQLWEFNEQDYSELEVTSNDLVIVSPTISSIDAYLEFGIKAIYQGDGYITFMCNKVPTQDIGINIIVIGGVE